MSLVSWGHGEHSVSESLEGEPVFCGGDGDDGDGDGGGGSDGGIYF